ncbi:MAG: hypothetical protein EHM83_17130, partial [Burkholderiales bacterium]
MKAPLLAPPSPRRRRVTVRSGARWPSLAALAAGALLASACASPTAPVPVGDARPVEAAAASQPEVRAPARLPLRPVGETAPEALPEVELTPQLMFQLLASEIAAQRGEVGSASATYLSMAQQTRDPRLARRATELALVERSLDRALPAAQLWHELSPNSPIATQTIESLWLTTGRFEDAEPLLRARLEKARAEQRLPDAYAQIQRALARTVDRKGALAMLDRLAAPDTRSTEARLALAAVAHSADDVTRAAAEAEAAMQLDPS